MAFTVDLATSRGKVRLLACHDTDAASPIFQDEDVDAFLALEGDSVKRAAALAIETIAGNQAFVLKVIKSLDLSTDGAKTSDALLKRAALLRGQAEDEEFSGLFDYAETPVTDFAARERILKELQRSGL